MSQLAGENKTGFEGRQEDGNKIDDYTICSTHQEFCQLINADVKVKQYLPSYGPSVKPERVKM